MTASTWRPFLVKHTDSHLRLDMGNEQLLILTPPASRVAFTVSGVYSSRAGSIEIRCTSIIRPVIISTGS